MGFLAQRPEKGYSKFHKDQWRVLAMCCGLSLISQIKYNRSDQSAPAKARTGRVDQNTHEGLQPFKGYRISLSWENRMTLEFWNAPFRGVVPKTPNSELITILATLMALVPKQHQKPSIKNTIELGLNTHTEDYIKTAILYTATHSNGGTWQKFKAYLGKCIDGGWADGWEPETDQGNQVDQEALLQKNLENP